MPDYRSNFAEDAKATGYDRIYSGEESRNFTNLVTWNVEKGILESLVEEFQNRVSDCDYLDFACGTGRVISHLENRVSHSTGIEISQAMLDICATRVTRSTLLCKDITATDETEDSYDLITAFRFFLKADPDLRQRAMFALARRLKDDRSWLIFNNHGRAPDSRMARDIMKKVRNRRVTMSDREVRELVDRAGLKIIRRISYENPASRVVFSLSKRAALPMEKLLAHTPLVRELGASACYVVQRA